MYEWHPGICASSLQQRARTCKLKARKHYVPSVVTSLNNTSSYTSQWFPTNGIFYFVMCTYITCRIDLSQCTDSLENNVAGAVGILRSSMQLAENSTLVKNTNVGQRQSPSWNKNYSVNRKKGKFF